MIIRAIYRENNKSNERDNEMFNFFGMMGNYEDRKVDRYEKDGLMVDTCEVTDSDQPFETAVEHPNYNEGMMVVVQMYDTKEEAQIGHDNWVKLMTTKNLPKALHDVSTAAIAKLCEAIGIDIRKPKERTDSISDETKRNLTCGK